MKRKTVKCPGRNFAVKATATTMALTMLLSGAMKVSAAEAEATASDATAGNGEVAEISVDAQSTNVVDATKTPEQLNVHVGDDASSQVNITYTTLADTSTVVKLNKVGDTNNIIYVEGNSYQGISNKFIHEISVSGLEAYTDYEYTVGDGFNQKSGTFRTGLAQNDTRTFTFAYIADTQVSNASNAKALGATLAEINEMNPDFVFLAGDTTDTATNEAQWEWLFNNDGAFPNGGEDMFANSLIAVTQGNHDNDELYQHINAPEEAGRIVYSFDYGTMKFISLNLESSRKSEDARDKQEAYLREQVADAKANGQWVVVGFHKSLYTGASHVDDGDVISARKFWAPIFSELDVDLVLQGHDHVYSRGFVTSEGENANPAVAEDGTIIQPENAPLYMVGGHAGGLKWYSKVNYTVTDGDPLALNYSFLDVNSTDTGSDIKKEQVITMLEVSEETINVVTYNFKYDTNSDTITTEKYVYDAFSVKRDLATNATSYIEGTELAVVENGDTLEYTVLVDNVVNANAFEVGVAYDAEKMELTGSESCLENTIYTEDENVNGVASMLVGVQKTITADEKTAIAKFNFKLKEGVTADEVVVSLIKADTVQIDETEAGVDSSDITTTAIKSQVNTEIYSYAKASDINGDGKVTLADLAVALLKYQTAEKICDINRDGVVNVMDYVMISSYMSE